MAPGAFACSHAGCGKTFTRQNNLTTHVRVAHSGERYVCPHPGCGKALRHKHRLASHLALHAAHPTQVDELRRAYPQPARASRQDDELRELINMCRAHELTLGGKCSCPGCGREFSPQGFGPHLSLCASAHAALRGLPVPAPSSVRRPAQPSAAADNALLAAAAAAAQRHRGGDRGLLGALPGGATAGLREDAVAMSRAAPTLRQACERAGREGDDGCGGGALPRAEALPGSLGTLTAAP
jgi:hypothetical protein